MKRIGVFGGTFNPIHIGHLLTVFEVLQSGKVDVIKIVPSSIPPHKNSDVIPIQNRLDMLYLAIKGLPPQIHIDTRETLEDASPYTFDTLASIKADNQDKNISLIIGDDWIHNLYTWKNAEEIISTYRIIVCARNYDIHDIKHKYPNFVFLDIPKLDISSTKIREKIQSEQSIRFLVPLEVEKYIYNNNLYLYRGALHDESNTCKSM